MRALPVLSTAAQKLAVGQEMPLRAVVPSMLGAVDQVVPL